MTTLVLNLKDRALLSKEDTIFLVGLTFSFVYALLPTLINGYNFPSGDDPYYYKTQLNDFPEVLKYYGIVPGKLIGLTTYYYLTPILVYLGLYIGLKRFSIWCPILTWIVLFFMVSPVLQDMEAGSFIGVLGFYAVGIPLLDYILKSDIRRSTLLLPIALAFHTIAGILITIGFVGSVISTRKFIKLVALIPLALLAVYFGIHGSSVYQVASLIPFIDTPTLDSLKVNQADYFPDVMPLDLFAKNYLGASFIAFCGVSGLMFYNAVRRGYRPKLDPLIISFLFLTIVLPIFTFTDLQINSDRMAKFLVGVLVILSSIGLLNSLKYLDNKWLNYSSITFIVLLLFGTALDQFRYWLSLGEIV